MYVGFRISAMHLDTVLPVFSIALVHPAEVLNFESPIAVRDGAANDSAVFHWQMLSREPPSASRQATSTRGRRYDVSGLQAFLPNQFGLRVKCVSTGTAVFDFRE